MEFCIQHLLVCLVLGRLSVVLSKNEELCQIYIRRVKEAIQIRLHSNKINRDNGIEIPEAWMPTIRKHNSRSTTKRTLEGTSSANRNNKDRNAPITANQRA